MGSGDPAPVTGEKETCPRPVLASGIGPAAGAPPPRVKGMLSVGSGLRVPRGSRCSRIAQRLSSGLCPVSLRSRRGGLDGLPGQNSPEFPWATRLVPPVAFVGKASVFPPPSLQAWGVPVPSPSPVVLARRRKLSGSLGSWAAAPDEPLRV